MKKIYLDYAAATPMDPQVLEAMRPYFTDKFYNPSATYQAGRQLKKELEQIRKDIALVLGSRPAEVIFAAGATEANNLAVQGVMRAFPQGEVLVSAIEHESVLAPARLFKHKEIPVTKQGIVDLHKLERMISDKTVLVSVMMVNNELGTIQPLADIAKMLNKSSILRRAKGNESPLYLHTDAAQAANYLDLHVSRLGVDLLSLNGGKIYGPKQSGILFAKAGTRLQPLIVGGGQEHGMRSGTENVAAAAGLAAALQAAAAERQAQARRITELREYFEIQIANKIPKADINGAAGHKAPHIVSVTIPRIDNERLMMELDEGGVECAVGSACSASREEASHVLAAIGLSDSDARSTLRFSLGRQTQKAGLQKAARLLAELCA